MNDSSPFSAADIDGVVRGAGGVAAGLAKLESDPGLRLARLAKTTGLSSIAHPRLMTLVPDFSVITFETALGRECVALRDEAGGLLVVVADPFDSDLLDGLGARLVEPFTLVLADRDDLTACLARHEDEVRRAAGLVESRDAGGGRADMEDLSLKRISADASPVVKLVNSTGIARMVIVAPPTAR
jgi:general secretion pathway protein E